MKKNTTPNDLFLEIFGEGNEKMLEFITPGIIENFKQTTLEFLKKQANITITQKLIKDLKEKTGDRLTIIRTSMKETPFFYHFSLIDNLGNKECEQTKKHLYYYTYTERDSNESESFYICIYCGKEGIKSKRQSLDGEIARTNYKPQLSLLEGKFALIEMTKTKPTEQEIKKFANIIVNLAF